MPGFPRVAVGSLGNRPPSGPATWALAGYLQRRGKQVQHFFSRACYCALQGGLTATGVASRHFDTWLMTRDACRTRLTEAFASSDFVVVEGTFESEKLTATGAGDDCDGGTGGSLDTLCRRLDLPRLVVLDGAAVAEGRFPLRPEVVDGVLLADVPSPLQFARLQTSLEGAWGVPVVGGLLRNDDVGEQLDKLPPGSAVPRDVCDRLIDSFAQLVDERAVEAIAARATIPASSQSATDAAPRREPAPTIAVAFDDAFCGYFPESLESLEQLGAKVIDFSPLRDESLPEGTDIVLLGCGRSDRHAAALAANHCLKAAVRDFARRGGRIYAEGGGLAYLSRWLSGSDGRDYPMLDLLPLAARRSRGFTAPQPTEFTSGVDTWLIPAGVAYRAYRDQAWTFDQLGTVQRPATANDHLHCIGDVIGSRLQLHLAAQPALLQRMFEPHRPAPIGHFSDRGLPT